MKKMIFSLIAAMMLLGSVNSNAQNNIRNDRSRQEMRQERVSTADRRSMPQKPAIVVDRVPDSTSDRVYVVKDNPRPVQVVAAVAPRDPRPRCVDPASNTVVAAAVGAAVGALITAVTQ